MIVEAETHTNEPFKQIVVLVKNHPNPFQVQISGNQITLKRSGPGRGLVVTSDDSSGYQVDNPFLGFQSVVDSGPLWSTHGRFVPESEALKKVEGWLNNP